jgi:Sec-independent protein translocase protein TatA
MAIVGFEWIVVGAIILLVFLLRPRAVTDLARSFGQVVAEFRKGKQDKIVVGEADELLSETAHKLGIWTEGKSPSQIREEILAKAGRG